MYGAASLARRSWAVQTVLVSASSLLTGWPNKISLVVWLQVKSSEQFGGPTSRILFMHDCNLEVSGKSQPGGGKSGIEFYQRQRHLLLPRKICQIGEPAPGWRPLRPCGHYLAGRLCPGQQQNQPLEDSAVEYHLWSATGRRHASSATGLLYIKTYGSCSYLPSSVFAATKHRVLYAYERFVHLLRNPCAGREHYTPLMDT